MKAAIIGAGINGLYLARKLCLAGHQMTVFEKKGQIGNSACSGLFSEKILEHIPQSKKLILNRIRFALINFPKKQIRLEFRSDFLVMSHFELDRLAADLAFEAGADIRLNQNISEIPKSFDRVIGCDGPMSFTRRSLGFKDPEYRLGILGFRRGRISADFVETWLLKNGGFIWKIPRGENTEYGIMADPGQAKKQLDSFLNQRQIVLENIQSKLIPGGLVLPENGRITLSGDASGLTKPWSGGGVIWQMEQADILAESFPDFNKYAKKVKRKFRKKIIAGRSAAFWLYFLGFRFPWLLPSAWKTEPDILVKKRGRFRRR